MVSPSRCPPWQPERPGPTRREPRRAQRSYTTRRDTIRNFTDRQRIKRKAANWGRRYKALPAGERLAMLAAMMAVDAEDP